MSIQLELISLLILVFYVASIISKELPENACIQNVLHTKELLFPSNKELLKIKNQSKSVGKVMTELEYGIEPYFDVWQFKPRNGEGDVVQIYHEKMGGYLNAYDNIFDDERRDVFVGNDRKDFWKIHHHPSIEGAVALENLPTGEYLYGVLGEKGKNLQYYPEQTSRSVFLWKFGSKNDVFNDNSSLWFLKACSYTQIDIKHGE